MSAGSTGRSPEPSTSNPDLLNHLFDTNFIALRRSEIFDCDPGPMPEEFDFNRVEGMLLGVAIGDALGITSESLHPRGALVEVDALLEALDSGQLGGYAADGVDPEPPPVGDRLIHHPRTIITPHSAALTASTYRRTCLRTVRNVLGYLTGSDYEAESVVNAAQLSGA